MTKVVVSPVQLGVMYDSCRGFNGVDRHYCRRPVTRLVGMEDDPSIQLPCCDDDECLLEVTEKASQMSAVMIHLSRPSNWDRFTNFLRRILTS